MSMYYPIGTIVRLTIDKEMLFMISGYLTRQSGYPIYDYFAVPFPLGLVKENQYILFDQQNIIEVVHEGYCDEECQSVLDGFEELVTNLKNAMPESNDK